MSAAVLHLTFVVQLLTAATSQPPLGECRTSAPLVPQVQTLGDSNLPYGLPMGAGQDRWTSGIYDRKRALREPSGEQALRLAACSRPAPEVLVRRGFLGLPGRRPCTGYSSGHFTSLPPPRRLV